jgi:hypothetical protein
MRARILASIVDEQHRKWRMLLAVSIGKQLQPEPERSGALAEAR